MFAFLTGFVFLIGVVVVPLGDNSCRFGVV